MIPVRFTAADAERAHDEWGANCGPGAIAAIAGLTLDEIRPHMGDFEAKRYTNPSLMLQVLRSLGLRWHLVRPVRNWPDHGLARVQWEGPWTAPGVPERVAYRHTHWVGARWSERRQGYAIFDINCMASGGWVSVGDWVGLVVPWLLGECEPKANGRWHLTHVIEVRPPHEVRA